MEKKKNLSQRESNYELLRIISAIAVIMIHVSAIYKNGITNSAIFGEKYDNHIFSIVLYNTLSRFAVPCFMMISGAFLLSEKRNANYKYFYKKTFYNIGIPTIIFSLLYVIFSECTVLVRIKVKGDNFSEILSPIKQLIKGSPYPHMWYMYTLLTVYLFIPVIIRIMNDIKEQTFKNLCVLSLIITTISGWTSSFELNWSVSKAICYLGYIMIGYHIRNFFSKRKSNLKALICILLGFTVEILLTYVQYNHSIRGISEIDEKYSLIENFNPLIVISAVLIFMGFSLIECHI